MCSFSSVLLPFTTCRLQPPPALVLYDLLHHPARAPRLPWHERVQEEIWLGVGRVLPNCSLPDHSPCLLRSPKLDTRAEAIFWVNNMAVKAHEKPKYEWIDWLIWLFRIFILFNFFTKNVLKSWFWTEGAIEIFFMEEKRHSLVLWTVWSIAFFNWNSQKYTFLKVYKKTPLLGMSC